MNQTIIMAIYTSLAIVGKVLVIMWGMSLAGSRHEEQGQDTSEHFPSREIITEKAFLGDGANRESAGELGRRKKLSSHRGWVL